MYRLWDGASAVYCQSMFGKYIQTCFGIMLPEVDYVLITSLFVCRKRSDIAADAAALRCECMLRRTFLRL